MYLSKVYFCEMYPTCVSSKLCEFICPPPWPEAKKNHLQSKWIFWASGQGVGKKWGEGVHKQTVFMRLVRDIATGESQHLTPIVSTLLHLLITVFVFVFALVFVFVFSRYLSESLTQRRYHWGESKFYIDWQHTTIFVTLCILYLHSCFILYLYLFFF